MVIAIIIIAFLVICYLVGDSETDNPSNKAKSSSESNIRKNVSKHEETQNKIPINDETAFITALNDCACENVEQIIERFHKKYRFRAYNLGDKKLYERALKIANDYREKYILPEKILVEKRLEQATQKKQENVSFKEIQMRKEIKALAKRFDEINLPYEYTEYEDMLIVPREIKVETEKPLAYVVQIRDNIDSCDNHVYEIGYTLFGLGTASQPSKELLMVLNEMNSGVEFGRYYIDNDDGEICRKHYVQTYDIANINLMIEEMLIDAFCALEDAYTIVQRALRISSNIDNQQFHQNIKPPAVLNIPEEWIVWQYHINLKYHLEIDESIVPENTKYFYPSAYQCPTCQRYLSKVLIKRGSYIRVRGKKAEIDKVFTCKYCKDFLAPIMERKLDSGVLFRLKTTNNRYWEIVHELDACGRMHDKN